LRQDSKGKVNGKLENTSNLCWASSAETETGNRGEKSSDRQEIESTVQEYTDQHSFHYPSFFFRC
jgi:hypothetical protein